MAEVVRFASAAALVAAISGGLAAGQTPQPFPRPGESRPQAAQPADAPARQPRQTPQNGSIDPNAPRADEVVFPVYPASQFLASFDAGRGQRYIMYGTTAAFTEIVAYYRTQLGDKGDLVFKEPPTHVFEVGRFRDDAMAFPPGVTVKDWMWGGSQGYPNPKPGAQPARYPTIIMIVPPPAGTANTTRR